MFQAPADQLHDGVLHQLAALLRLLLLLLIHSPVPSDQESHIMIYKEEMAMALNTLTEQKIHICREIRDHLFNKIGFVLISRGQF